MLTKCYGLYLYNCVNDAMLKVINMLFVNVKLIRYVVTNNILDEMYLKINMLEYNKIILVDNNPKKFNLMYDSAIQNNSKLICNNIKCIIDMI